MNSSTIRVREPRELLALLPYQLGFRPQDSAVAVSLRPPRGRVGLVARVDLADLGDPDDGPQLARALVSHLAADGAHRAVLVLYTDRDPRYRSPDAGSGTGTRRARSAAEAFRAAAEPFLGDVAVWVVASNGYLALDCDDDDCCPVGGRSLRDLEGTIVGAHMVLAGALVEDSRESLARITPASSTARHNAVRVANRWRSGRAEASGEALERWRAGGLAAWRAAVRTDAPAQTALLGRIMATLADVRVRDAVLLALVPGTGDLPERSLAGGDGGGGRAGTRIVQSTSDALAHILDPARGTRPDEELLASGARVLGLVVAHAGPAYSAPALTLLALLAWWQADGARAGVLLDRALEADPSHRLALLLAEALAGGLPPGWVGARQENVGEPPRLSSGTVG